MPGDADKSSKGKEWLSCRDVLWYVSFFGFAIDYILRLNFSLAIVAMVLPRPEAVAVAQCVQNSDASNVWVNASSLTTTKEQNGTLISITSLASQNVGSQRRSQRPRPRGQGSFKTETHFREKGRERTGAMNKIVRTLINETLYPDRFSWNEYEQGLALGAYYWLHWTAQIPGGLLARRYGTKLIFGWANFAPALLGFLLPFFARQHLYAFLFLRVLQGMAAGLAWPAMHNMTAKWIPPNERGKFISSYLGSSVGAALTYPLSAFLVDWFGWSSVFYVTSLMGVIWYIAWYFLAYDTPQEHPRISNSEKNHILDSLGDSVNHGRSNVVPWKAILTSRPTWIIVIAEMGSSWGVLTVASQAPSYFNYIHGWSISAAGFFSAAPHVARMLFSIAFSILADSLLKNNKMSRSKLRKFATLVSNGLQSVMLFGLAFSGCRPILAIVFMIAAMTVGGACSSGVLANSVDLSPNYASVIIGIVNTIATSSGFISPTIVGILTNNNQTIEQWRLVFLIAFVILFSSACIYTVFGSSQLQPWNDAGNEEVGEELQKLRADPDKVVFEETRPEITRDGQGIFSAVDTENPDTTAHNRLQL